MPPSYLARNPIINTKEYPAILFCFMMNPIVMMIQTSSNYSHSPFSILQEQSYCHQPHYFTSLKIIQKNYLSTYIPTNIHTLLSVHPLYLKKRQQMILNRVYLMKNQSNNHSKYNSNCNQPKKNNFSLVLKYKMQWKEKYVYRTASRITKNN